MRIGLTYLYSIFQYGYPPSLAHDLRSFREIRDLGFHFIELEGLGGEKLLELSEQRERVREELRANELHVHNFCVVVPELVHPETDVRRPAYELFEIGAQLGEYFGAETLHLASYPPPVEYIETKPYQLATGEPYKFADHTRVHIPRSFRWQQVWDTLVESCRACSDIAARHGKAVLMEPRVGEVICSVDSLLRLIEHVDRPNFKANFDTAHFSAQRENVPLALVKLEGKFANIHIADNNPVDTEHLPVGDGVIDWREFFCVLKRLRYEGYLGLDLALNERLLDSYRRSIERIQSIAQELDLHVEV